MTSSSSCPCQVFLGLTMLGFAFAFFSLFREDRDTEYSDFTNFWHAVVSMLSYLLAMFDYNIFYNSTNPVSAMLLFIVFEFVMNVMLLNIMIAVMTSSLSKATWEEGHRFLLSRAALIDELEATLPRCLRRPAWSPPFIHLLKGVLCRSRQHVRRQLRGLRGCCQGPPYSSWSRPWQQRPRQHAPG
ncbi:hypothetical protein V8C86DRAFT_331024 [Haematococcus lacustris]